ncbi:MAG: energy-coupling factor transporter transmembrane protein EcfT [Elusimicrobia bacterium]|nr:energy-coupling factor transporter transmembrane protein EcfT [Elusimicrobiota bacterium]
MNLARHFLMGRYLPGRSPVHRVDPRIKLAFLVAVSVTLFSIVKMSMFAVPFVLYGAVTLLSGINPLKFLRGFVPLAWIVFFVFFMHYVMPPHDLGTAVTVSLRLVLLFGWATVITATTPAMELTRAVAWYMSPLKVFGVSPERTALTFSLALRFFPVILEEADSIIRAQKLRGGKSGVMKKIEVFSTVFLMRMFRRAENIGDALCLRGVDEEHMKRINRFGKMSLLDAAACAVCALYVAVVAGFNAY